MKTEFEILKEQFFNENCSRRGLEDPISIVYAEVLIEAQTYGDLLRFLNGVVAIDYLEAMLCSEE